MKKLKWLFLVLFLLVSASLLTTSSYVCAELTAVHLTSEQLGLGASDAFGVHIEGTRQSDTAWGLGEVNYMAGMVASQRMPSEGSAGFRIMKNPAGDIFGEGTGYKAFIQYWNDPENYIAFGLIKDPAAAPWGGVTLMVEGAAYGQPIGGYWPQGHAGFDGSMDHHFAVFWYPDRIEITLDIFSEQEQTLVYNINMDNPSIACLGAARMPGDKVDAGIAVLGFSDNVSVPPFTLVTWDPEFKELDSVARPGPFAGTFSTQFDDAAGFVTTVTLSLNQLNMSAETISGTITLTTSGCCTATSNGTVSGTTVAGSSTAELSANWDKSSCTCADGGYGGFNASDVPAATATLSDGGNVLEWAGLKFQRQ